MREMVKGYIGMFQQPIQHPESDNPTMFMVMDNLNKELDLILLTPGTFAAAYKAVMRINPVSIRIFIPSLREEYISDVFNLYHILKDKKPVKWVFPEKSKHIDFRQGQEIAWSHVNENDSYISVCYVENPHVSHVYDIIVKNEDGVHLFSQYLTTDEFIEYFNDSSITYIHLPASKSVYGGMVFTDVMKMKKFYLDSIINKVIPHSFTSIEEFYYLLNLQLM